ncbi:hypothetical protein DFH08DRAFT_1072894 [Mycena albidolilacea]|uniref:Uncharacterized protein n=1 Tax=Mycena albidolilacea TaxID=1033008 RepID=A0AAD7ANT9_9AGAR|nr:hypothetical protein DFH08DRAFT_1072894 [Mycena albidolilacea]
MASFVVELYDTWKPGRRGPHHRSAGSEMHRGSRPPNSILACVAGELDKARSGEEWIARRTLYSEVNGGVGALSAESYPAVFRLVHTDLSGFGWCPGPLDEWRGGDNEHSCQLFADINGQAWGELVEDLREVRWGKVPPWLDPGPQSIVVWDEASFARSTTLRRAPSAWSAQTCFLPGGRTPRSTILDQEWVTKVSWDSTRPAEGPPLLATHDPYRIIGGTGGERCSKLASNGALSHSMSRECVIPPARRKRIFRLRDLDTN